MTADGTPDWQETRQEAKTKYIDYLEKVPPEFSNPMMTLVDSLNMFRLWCIMSGVVPTAADCVKFAELHQHERMAIEARVNQ